MVNRSYQRSKGAMFERDVLESMQQVYPDMFLTHHQGFVKQWNLQDDSQNIIVECKFHKSITWNRAKKWFEKLQSVIPKGYRPFLVFKSNQQPVLVMDNIHRCGELIKDEYRVSEFEHKFQVPFIKHTPVKRR